MSPLVEFIVDLVASGFGGGFNSKPRRPFVEGDANASLGAVAAFAGALAVIFAIALFVNCAYDANLSAKEYAAQVRPTAVQAAGRSLFGSRRPRVRQYVDVLPK
jgi:hypothetical protein